MSNHNDTHDMRPPSGLFGSIVRWGFVLISAGFVLGLVGWGFGVFTKVVTKPVDMAVGVADRVIDPDHALQTYRWFHEANQQVRAKQSQITLLKSALVAAESDRKEARRVELLGLQMNCQTLVSEYNAKAMRADTVIFQHPERFLPGDWPGDRTPLPSNLDLMLCN